MQEMEKEISSLIGTIQTKTRHFEAKEAESLDMIRELRRKINGLKEMLEDSNASNKDLTEQITAYVKEIERLKAKLLSDKRFKQFVDIKRENTSLKGENEKLSLLVKDTDFQPKIPMMKKSGKVTVKRSRVMSAGPLVSHVASSSGEGKLRRPKSSNVRTLVSMYADNSEDLDHGVASSEQGYSMNAEHSSHSFQYGQHVGFENGRCSSLEHLQHATSIG